MKKIGVFGSGRLAGIIAKAIKDGVVEGVELDCIFSRNKESGMALGEEVGCFVTDSSADFMARKPDYILEAASRDGVREYTQMFLENGADVLILTTGPFGDSKYYEEIKAVAKSTQRKVHLVSGVVGGFDIMTTGQLMGNMSAEFSVMRTKVSEEDVFEGSAWELYSRNQGHLNVAVSVGLGSAGVDETKAQLMKRTEGDKPGFATTLEGDFGKAYIYTEMGKGPAMAAWSAVATLKRLVEPISF